MGGRGGEGGCYGNGRGEYEDERRSCDAEIFPSLVEILNGEREEEWEWGEVGIKWGEVRMKWGEVVEGIGTGSLQF